MRNEVSLQSKAENSNDPAMMRVTNIYGVFYLFIYLNEKPRKTKKKEEKLSKWPQEMSVYHTESK